MAELFGFKITRSDTGTTDDQKTFIPPQHEDGAIEIAAGGHYGQYLDLEGTAKNEAQLVNKYREMSLQPECDRAIEDVVNEAIVSQNEAPVELMLDDIKGIPASVKKKIREEFNNVLKLLNFSNTGYDIFRRWYIDGRLYHHIIISEDNPREGIKEVRYIDPRKIKKIRERSTEKDPRTGATLYKKQQREYYMYNAKGIDSTNTQGIKIAVDSISYCHSGLADVRNKIILGHLNKAMKVLNQLRMLEDATIIYRLARAPERRIFYIDVGNLPKMKAEQYLRDMMAKHKNKLVYDANTGEVRDDRKFMTMLEDFWLPRRDGGRGTEITTLPGGQNLGEMDDVEYFRKKLYESLNVPTSRLDSEGQFNVGRSSEVTRDEIKYNKFIVRLRNRFSHLFNSLLEVQLVLKGIITKAEWDEVKNELHYDFKEDNYYSELKESEILTERLRLAGDVDQYVGKYYSMKWVRENVLRMTEEDSIKVDQEIAAEASMVDDDGNVTGRAEYGDGEGDQPAARNTPSQDGDSIDTQPQGNSSRPQRPTRPQTEPRAEEFVPSSTISEEEKKLVESMTRFVDSMASEHVDDGYE